MYVLVPDLISGVRKAAMTADVCGAPLPPHAAGFVRCHQDQHVVGLGWGRSQPASQFELPSGHFLLLHPLPSRLWVQTREWGGERVCDHGLVGGGHVLSLGGAGAARAGLSEDAVARCWQGWEPGSQLNRRWLHFFGGSFMSNALYCISGFRHQRCPCQLVRSHT